MMAYYSSNYYQTDAGEYDQIQYTDSYDFSPTQASMAFPSFDINEHTIFGYVPTPTPYYHPALSHPTMAYSTATFSEPMSIEHDVNYSTRFIVSYSVSESNDTEFDEYDPTPYGGGYDPAQTYGKPLLPSDEICHPRSSMDPGALNSNGFSYGSIASPYGKEGVGDYAAKPRNGSKPEKANQEEEKTQDGIGEKLQNGHDNGHGIQNGKPLDSELGGSGSGLSSEQCDYEYEKQVPQPPPGYGLEAMDLCESIFGYWPCLSKYNKNNGCQYDAYQDCNGDQWQRSSADYLFGNYYPYGERRYGGGNYGNHYHGYGPYGYE